MPPATDIDRIPRGKWVISFTLDLEHTGGASSHVVSETFDVKSSRPKGKTVTEMAHRFIQQHYHHSNTEMGTTRDIDVRKAEGADLRNVKLKGARPLQYKLLPEDTIINKNTNECVLDYMMSQIHQVWKTYTRQQLIEFFGADCVQEGVSANQIMAWSKARQTVSCYVLDPFLKCIECVHTVGSTVDLMLVFIINNDHLYPVIDPVMKHHVATCKSLELGQVKFDVIDFSSCRFISSGYIDTLVDRQLRDTVAVLSATVYPEKVLFLDQDDLGGLMRDVIRTTQHLVINTSFRHSIVDGFQHPVTGQIWLAASQYIDRRDVCAHMLRKFQDYIGFRFGNQSWMKLAKEHFKLTVGELTESVYGPDYLSVLASYPIAPYVVQVCANAEVYAEKDIKSFDGRLCYTSIIESNACDYNVFSAFDEITPIELVSADLLPGEYYVQCDIVMGGGTIKLVSGWYPRVFVAYALKKSYISLADITYALKASSSLPHDLMKDWSMGLRKDLTPWPSASKSLVNHFIGQLNKQYTHINQGAVTDSWDIAVGTLSHDAEVRVLPFGRNLFFMRKTQKERVLKGSAPIWRHIIASSWMYLDQLHSQVVGPDTTVLCYNTDSIKVVNPQRCKTVIKKFANPGDIVLESSIHIKGTPLNEIEPNPVYAWKDRSWSNVDSSVCTTSYLVTGMPGSGKTYQLIQRVKAMIRAEVKCVVLGFTNKAVDTVRKQGIKDVYTLDKYFHKDESFRCWVEKAVRLDCIVLEEFSMIPKKWYSLFWELKYRKPSMLFHLYGDVDQTHAIECDNRWYDYGTAELVKVLCDHQKHEFDYNPSTGRYDAAMHAELIHFRATGRLSDNWKAQRLFGPTECEFNITQSRGKTNEVNLEWLASRSVGQTCKAVGDLSMYVGMPVMSFQNYQHLNVYNSNRLFVKAITDKAVMLEIDTLECEFSVSEFNKQNGDKPVHFGYGYSETLIRTQGETLQGRYNIHEACRMSWNELYTALSRGTCQANIGIVWTDKVFKRHVASTACKQTMLKACKLKRGLIYQMVDQHGYCYIGSTDRTLEQRELEHRNNPTSLKMGKWLTENAVVMTMIDSFTFADRSQLLKAEKVRIASVDPTKCMNSKHKIKEATEVVDVVVMQVEAFSRFVVTDDEKGKRFRIRWTDNGKRSDKEFSYKVKAKAEVRAVADAFRNELLKKNYM